MRHYSITVLITNRKLYTSFRIVPKSVTLNDLEWRNGSYFALFHRIRYLRREIKRTRRTALGERSERAIDCSPQIERTGSDVVSWLTESTVLCKTRVLHTLEHHLYILNLHKTALSVNRLTTSLPVLSI